MTVLSLLWQRVRADWKFQIKVWRTTVDWTVAFYLVIPTLFFALKAYVGWWSAAPSWLKLIPFSLWISVTYLFTLLGPLRLFLEDADQLFLIPRHTWARKLMALGISYSTLRNLLTSTALFLILTPLLIRHYELTFFNILSWFSLTFIWKTINGVISQLIALRFKSWRQRFVQIVQLGLTGFVYRESIIYGITQPLPWLLISLPLMFLAGLLIHRRLKLKGTFYADIAREQAIKLRFASVLLRAAQVYTKKGGKTITLRKRPLLFSNSNLLFKQRSPVNGLVELCFKSVVRNNEHLKIYGWLLVICLLLIVAIPPTWKWLAWIIFLVMLGFFVSLFWRETLDSPFLTLFAIKPEDKFLAARKAIFLLTLPGFLLLSLALGLQTLPLWGTIALLAISLPLANVAAKLVALFA